MTSRGNSDDTIDEGLNKLEDTIKKLKQEAADSLIKSKRSKQTRLILSESYISKKNPLLFVALWLQLH